MKTTKINFQCIIGQPDKDTLQRVAKINQDIFGFNESADALSKLFRHKTNILIYLAFKEKELVGFKIGFEKTPFVFESWRGGVTPSERRKGIAMKLMQLQHEWCRRNHYRVVKTTTNSDNVGMLLLNRKSGFEIVGRFRNSHQRVKILQEKHFTQGP